MEKFQNPAEKKFQQDMSNIAISLAIDVNTALQTIQFRLISFEDLVNSVDASVHHYLQSKKKIEDEFALSESASEEQA